MNDFQQFPKTKSRLQGEIITILLKMKAVPAEYPRELYEPRRDAYLAQVETIKESRPGRQTGDGRQ